MSDEELEPLAPNLRALLDAAGDGPPAPHSARGRVFARVESTVDTAAEEPAAANAEYHAPARDSAGFRRSIAPRSLAWRVQLLAAVFAAGALLGAVGVYIALSGRMGPASNGPMAQTPAPSAGPSAVMPAGDTPHSVEAPRDPIAPPSAHTEPHSAPSAAAPQGRDTAASAESSLSAERALVETARAALARADTGTALSLLERHARQFPNGTLAEEREALAVQALAKMGDKARAKTRAQRFRERFPQSMFLPVIDEATREN